MANTRERVKDFPSIVGTIQSDDYIPVDGATQGVRKAQVKDIMDAPITGLDTIANTTKGAINELATTAGKVWVGTQAEYDDLPDTKLTDNVLHCITDGEPSAYDSIWDKVGTDPLATIAPDCSGAINELKQSLADLQFKAVTGHSVGTAELSLPSSWDELILQVYVQQSILTTIVLNPMVPNSYTNIGLGAYGSSWAIGQIKKDKVKILTVNWGGTDVTANASLYAFYKKY